MIYIIVCGAIETQPVNVDSTLRIFTLTLPTLTSYRDKMKIEKEDRFVLPTKLGLGD